MSNPQTTLFGNEKFVERLIEICGTDKPAEIARRLDVSYQTSKNYLEGRLPETSTIISIAEKTGCSIDWLLIGQGKKFIKDHLNQDTPQLSDEIKSLIRAECERIVVEILSSQTKAAKEKVFTIHTSDIKEEKILEKKSDLLKHK